MSRVVSPRQHYFTTFAVLAAASLVWLWLLPVESVTRVVAARAIALIATLILVRRIVALSGSARIAWTLVWAYQALTLIADLVYADLEVLDAEPAFPNPSDLLYLITYAFAFAAVWAFGGLLHAQIDPRLRLELRAVAAAAALVVALVLVGPWLLEGSADLLQPVVALAYPLLDVLLVLTVLAVLHGRVRGNRSMQLLLSAFALFLVLDGVYYLLAIAGDATEYRLLEVGWTAALLLISFAAYAPGAAAVEPEQATRPALVDA